MEEKIQLDDFYFMLEEALQARSTVSEDLEGLEHLSLDKNTTDPYLQALYFKHGLFEPVDLKRSFEAFNGIEYSAHKPWEYMKIPIQAFVSYHLSLFHLGYQNVTERNLELAEKYFNDSIKLGHRMAMFERAEEILESLDLNNLDIPEVNRAIELYKLSIDAGYSSAHVSIIECYRLLLDFKSAAKHYDILINELMFENMIPEFQRYYDKLTPEESSQYAGVFVTLLMKSKFVKAHTAIVANANRITEAHLDEVFADNQTETKLNNLLLLFNSNNLLYQKYISKLFKSWNR